MNLSYESRACFMKRKKYSLRITSTTTTIFCIIEVTPIQRLSDLENFMQF
jgi:hypothetical protein